MSKGTPAAGSPFPLIRMQKDEPACEIGGRTIMRSFSETSVGVRVHASNPPHPVIRTDRKMQDAADAAVPEGHADRGGREVSDTRLEVPCVAAGASGVTFIDACVGQAKSRETGFNSRGFGQCQGSP